MYVRARLEGLHGTSSLGSCLLGREGGRRKKGEEGRRGQGEGGEEERREGRGKKEGKGGGGLGSMVEPWKTQVSYSCLRLHPLYSGAGNWGRG